MSMFSKIESVSRPLQSAWIKAVLLAAGVIAYQVLVYRMVVDQPDSGLGEGLMAAPVVAMYLGENAWRLWRYPNFSRASIATVFRAFRNFDFNRPTAGR